MSLLRNVLLVSIAKGILIIGSPPPFVSGVAYSYTFTASGQAAKYTFTKSGALPTGITFTDNGNGTATLAGTTSATGSYPISITLTSNTRLTTTRSFILSVPGITLQLLQTVPVTRGIPVSGLSLSASGGSGGYVYSATGLPVGLALNTATGAITGTVTGAVNTYSIVASAHDTVPTTANLTVPLIVNSRLSLTSSNPAPPGEVGKSLTYSLAVAGATGAVTYTAVGATNGLSLSTAGVLSGTPTAQAGMTFNTTATDAGTGDTLAVALLITVNAPVSGNFKNAPEYVLSAGTNYPQLPLAADVAGAAAAVFGVAPYSYTFDAAYAPGISVNATTGFLSGTPTTPRLAYWSTAGNMAAGRQLATATLLNTGKVLLVGGNNGTYLNSSELYDPAGNNWSAGGVMTNARAFHASTILQSGKVLTTGGFNGAMLNACELYDPAGNSWASGGVMTGVRNQHTATLLNTGKVLVVAGDNLGTPVNTCELYDNVGNSWSTANTLTTARTQHTATLLQSGKVLVCGGSDSVGSPLATCQIYDPAGNSWSAAAAMSNARYQHTATLLSNGKVLVVGGFGGAGVLTSCELYDPVGNTWSAAAGLMTGRYRHSAALLLSGELLVTGGTPSAGPTLGTAEVYNPIYDAWNLAGRMAFNRYLLTATLMTSSGKVLVAGGLPSFPTAAELFDPGLKITVTDALGATAIQYVALTVNRPNPSLQHKLNGAAVGSTITSSVNYTGSAVSDVTNDGNTANVVLVPYAATTGTNTYVATLSPAPLQYTTNATYKIKFTNANTGASTLNLNGLGALPIQLNGAALASGQIAANSTLDLLCTGATFQIVGNMGAASAAASGYLLAGDWTTFNNKQSALVAADATHNGYLLAADWTTFNNKQSALVAADATHNGYLLSADWTTFNNKQAAFGNQSANLVYAGPTFGGAAALPTFRSLTGADLLTYVEWLAGGTFASNTCNLTRVNAATFLLPAAPLSGDIVQVIPSNGVVAMTIDPQTLKIEGTAGTMTCNVFQPTGRLIPFTLVYTNAANGWKLS